MPRPAQALFALSFVVFAVLGTSAPADAQQMRCAITSAVGPSFGGYDTLSTAPVDSAGYVALRCDRVGPADWIVIELSRGRSNTFLPRRMMRRGERLEYNLYLDAARTLVWGDGTRGTSRWEARPPEGRTISIPIYGRIPPRQTVTPGAYSDHVMLTVQY